MHLFNPVIPNLSIESPINKVKIMSKFLAEFIGTYALVFFGTRAIIVNQEASGVVTNVGIAIIFGLIVMAMIYTLGNVSGAHINPAVSIAFAIAKRFPLNQLFPYICCQIAGGIAASLTLKFLFPLNGQWGAKFPQNNCKIKRMIIDYNLY
jgi:aquaporin Z